MKATAVVLFSGWAFAVGAFTLSELLGSFKTHQAIAHENYERMRLEAAIQKESNYSKNLFRDLGFYF